MSIRSLGAALSVLALAAPVAAEPAPASPTAGFSPEAVRYKIQWPYNVRESERVRESRGAYFFFLRNDDLPFERGNTTKPRVELRFPDYGPDSVQQYEADLLVPHGTAGVCVMQIHTGDHVPRRFGATTFMVFVEPDDGGSLHYYSQPRVLAGRIWDRWFHLNVIHDVPKRTISMYVDNRLVFATRDKGTDDYYMKTGLYAQHGATPTMQVVIKNLRFWTR